MAEEYDIFISYRRFEDEARQKENISKARSLSETFARRGFKVFFDQNERTAKALKEKILPAVRNSRCFVLLLTYNCMLRCKDEGDWVRKEIEEAHKYNKTIVPVTLDNVFKQWPDDLPESLKFLSDNEGIDITNIHNDTSYASDIDGLISDVIGAPIDRNKGAEVHIETDCDCHVLRFKEELMLARKNDDNVLYLRKGKHKLVFEADGCREVKRNEIVEIPDIDYSTFVEVHILDEFFSNYGRKVFERNKPETMIREQKERHKSLILDNKQNDWKEVECIERETEAEFVVNGVIFKMVKVEGGTFMMGATVEQEDDADSDEKPVHEVKVRDYYMGETVVTQELWKTIMGTNPSQFRGDDLPVDSVSWEDAQTFIEKLNSLFGCKFRLPSEAEWEYAARGGNMCKGYRYSGSNNIDEVAWYDNNSGYGTHPVKMRLPNELDLYDMSGNVWEWCQDRYGKYSDSTQTSPQEPLLDIYKVIRGGSWSRDARDCRVSYRSYDMPTLRNYNLGFRLVMEL